MKNPFKRGIRAEIFDILSHQVDNLLTFNLHGHLMPAHTVPMEIVVHKLKYKFSRLEFTRDIRRTLEQLRKLGYEIERHEVKIRHDGETRIVVCHGLGLHEPKGD